MRRPFVLAAAAILSALAPATAQTGGAQTPVGTTGAAYAPGLGDIMTTTIQPRHLKLALAGRAKNWDYAAYELHELQEAFDRAARTWPQWQSVSIAELMPAATRDSIKGMASAIKSADGDRFAAAYAHLTDTCNACHQAAGRAMIVIKVPEEPSFPDQDFTPPKP